MRRRIAFRAWGRRVDSLRLPAYAYATDDQAPIEAVARAIERSTRLTVCGGPRSDGTALERGKPSAHHYQMTLGRPCSGGGYTPEAEVWVAIPVGQGR